MKNGETSTMRCGTGCEVSRAGGETWCKIDAALRQGKRGLEDGQTIGKLLAEYRGVRNVHSIKPLSVDQILAWADNYHMKHGRWPRRMSRPIDGEPGDRWITRCAMDCAGNQVALHSRCCWLPSGACR
jgi:hypothetical protein